ncbi:hypothetical protein B0H17DRAFT_1232007 [Mycena rosella]|uniref:DNA 3'-5' helicase n=1 Tax=Mycena rosella TaxID=1033263 RepID=A0AAD7D9F6_MYCRO|nr:hypothetical protein B0H17DRAFT_1232007 [Mycena rosella]
MSSPLCRLCNHPVDGDVPCRCAESAIDEDDVDLSPGLTELEESPFFLLSWGLTTTTLLKSVGVSINQRYNVYICCGGAFTSENVVAHLRSHESGRLDAAVSEEIKRVSLAADIQDRYPELATRIPTQPLDEIAGLAIKSSMFGCPGCCMTAVKGKVTKHMQSHGHKGKLLSGLSAQIVPENAGSDLLATFKAFDWQQHRTGAIPNARMISPWLMRTRWPQQILRYREHAPELLQLVAMPSDKDANMQSLQATVTAYLDRATQLIDATDGLVLQTLNSHDPDKDGINNTPLHAHHQGKKTMSQYALPITHLISGLLRRSEHYQFPTSDGLAAALKKLRADALIGDGVAFLAKSIFPLSGKATTDYAEMLFMGFGKEFTSDNLSNLMAFWSTPILGWGMKIAVWRQINIAWRRKLCSGSGSMDAIEDDATSTVNALQSGHSLNTERKVYGLSPESFLGAPEDVLYLYLNASTDWQKATEVVPGGLGLPYKAAVRDKFQELVACGTIKLKLSAPITAGAIATASNMILDPSLSKMFLDFQHQSGKADSAMLSKQDKTLKLITELQEQVAQLHKMLLLRGPPRDETDEIMGEVPSLSPALPLPPPPPPPRQQSTGPSFSLPGWQSPSSIASQDILPLYSAPPTPPCTAPVQPVDMLRHLRSLYGPDAHWKSIQQYLSLREILALKSDVIVADRTGGGKTAAAILPSFVEDGYTVIVIPSVALMDDWIRRLDALGVKYEHFLGARGPLILHGRHNLILVSSDVAVRQHWTTAITQLNARGKPVLRYIVDEVQHYCMDFVFRPALANPFALRVFPFQVVLMSATMPREATKFLIKQFLLEKPRRISAQVSDRHELNLRVYKFDTSEKMMEEAGILIESCLARSDRWLPECRFLVFVNSYADGLALSAALKLPFYHASTTEHPLTDIERRNMYKNWVKGRWLGLVATNGLGGGNDYPHVRFTIHYQAPYNLVTFEQQRTRAGRDGEPSMNFVLISARPRSLAVAKHNYGDLAGEKAMSDLLYGKKTEHPASCLVYGITSFMDVRGQSCIELGRKNRCKPCQEIDTTSLDPFYPVLPEPEDKPLFWTPPQRGVKRKLPDQFNDVTERAQKRTGKLAQDHYGRINTLETFFAMVEQKCGYCVALQVPAADHPGWACPMILSDASMEAEFRSLRSQIHYTGKAAKPCFTCHIPSLGADTFHPSFVKGQTTCDRPNLALPLAYYL